MLTQSVNVLGLIAGNRSLPMVFARTARQMGVRRLVAVAFENETDPALADLVDQITWIKVGQLSKLVAAFKRNGVQECVMLGQVAPKNLFEVQPDLRAVKLLFKLKERNAHTIFGALAQELEQEGIRLIEPIPWLRPLMPGRGFHLGLPLTDQQQQDLAFGFRIAKEVSRLEIGQLVVVKGGTVLAVEALEGTDRCLARGGQLGGPSGGALAIKVAKEKHDLRFDIPCVGPQTLKTCAEARIAVLALEADKTLLLEQEHVKQLTSEHNIAVTVIDELTTDHR